MAHEIDPQATGPAVDHPLPDIWSRYPFWRPSRPPKCTKAARSIPPADCQGREVCLQQDPLAVRRVRRFRRLCHRPLGCS